MKLVINQTRNESFLFDNDKIVSFRVAYSLVKSYNKSWDFTDDKINIREYTKIDSLFDKLTRKKHLTF
jgi:hypothetical protein